MDRKPITVYTHVGGPNPFKVLIVLEELGVPYEKIVVADPKEAWFVAINPNGRVPAIKDPNTDITLWESGAIVEYLVETYDLEGKLSVTNSPAKWEAKQYLHFQMSGQGPYFGQNIWFHKCPEDIPTAKQRYIEQTLRVFEVLDNIIKGKQYLVEDRLTYVDLCFLPWDKAVRGMPFLQDSLWKKYDAENKYPHFWAWHQRLLARPSVARAYAD